MWCPMRRHEHTGCRPSIASRGGTRSTMPCGQPDPDDEADAGFVDYGDRDREIVDYQFYQLPDAPGIGFRGPDIDNDDGADFFTCIGSAQTLGVLVEKPFPTLDRKSVV